MLLTNYNVRFKIFIQLLVVIHVQPTEAMQMVTEYVQMLIVMTTTLVYQQHKELLVMTVTHQLKMIKLVRMVVAVLEHLFLETLIVQT